MIQRAVFILAIGILIAHLWGVYKVDTSLRSQHPKADTVERFGE